MIIYWRNREKSAAFSVNCMCMRASERNGVRHAFQAENDSRHSHKYNFHLFSISSHLFHVSFGCFAISKYSNSNPFSPLSLLLFIRFSSLSFFPASQFSLLSWVRSSSTLSTLATMLTFSSRGFYPQEIVIASLFFNQQKNSEAEQI